MQLRGQMATRSGLYTMDIVKAVGSTMLKLRNARGGPENAQVAVVEETEDEHRAQNLLRWTGDRTGNPQGGGAASTPRFAPASTSGVRVDSNQGGGAASTPRSAPPLVKDGPADSKQGDGAASTPRPRARGESHPAPSGKQGGEDAKTSDDFALEETAEEEEQDQPMMEWRPGVKPTAAPRAVHEATHVPYAWWCGTCVEGQGRDDAHRKVRGDDGPPVIELDYSFMRTSEPEDTGDSVARLHEEAPMGSR